MRNAQVALNKCLRSMRQAAEEALEQGVWADAAAGQLWAAQRLGPAGAAPAEVWRALAALGARPRRLAWLANTLLVRRRLDVLYHARGHSRLVTAPHVQVLHPLAALGLWHLRCSSACNFHLQS
jgi:hypothetical protein